MSIADKLTTIAENQQAVFDAGYYAGQESGGGDPDEAWNEGFNVGYESGYADGEGSGYFNGLEVGREEGLAEGIEQGKQAEYDAFWDVFQSNTNNGAAGIGKRLHYAYAFAYNGWTDKNYNPKYPIDYTNTNGIANMFTWNVNVTDTKVPITANGNCNNAFGNSNIVRIPKLIFRGATNVSNMFLNCSKLEELYCEGELTVGGLDLSACTKLNKESLISVVDALSTAETTSGLSITLSLTAVNNAFLNDEASSVEWNDLINGKENWTIILA